MNASVSVDESLYPIEAVLGAAYVFLDRCFVFLDRSPDGAIRVQLRPKPGPSASTDLAGEFQNELLGQALRHRIAARHEKVRETIVARALFGAAPRLSEPEVEGVPEAPTDEQLGVEPRFVPVESDDYLDDPLGIAVPWEEKYGKPAEEGAGAPPPPAADAPERSR